MQVDAPHQPPSSLRGFIQQYAMIVLSILTALALEQIVVSIHNASNARASRARIETELAVFLMDLKRSEQVNTERLNTVTEVLDTLDAKLKDGNPDDATVQALAGKVVDELGINFPTYQREAWEAAIADQSASHLDTADLRRYAEIYADQLLALEEARLLLTGDYVRRLSDTNLAFRIGKLDGRALAETLTLDLLAGTDILHHQQRLIRLIESGQHPAPTSH